MEKRFLLFMLLAMGILLGHALLNLWLMDPAAQVAEEDAIEQVDAVDEEVAEADADAAGAEQEPAEPADAAGGESDEPAAPAIAADPAEDAEPDTAPAAEVPTSWVALGSADNQSPYKLMVLATNRGAAIVQVEIVEKTKSGHFRFENLDNRSGYLGWLALSESSDGGCLVNVVPPGTPASFATPSEAGVEPGLKVGDAILSVNGVPVPTPRIFEVEAAKVRPAQDLVLEVAREGFDELIRFTARLTERPFVLMGPEAVDPLGPGTEPAFQISLGAATTRRVKNLATDPGLAEENWEISRHTSEMVEFRFRPPGGDLEFLKRYQLVPPTETEKGANAYTGYQLTLEVEIRNTGSAPRNVAYRLQGPNGLATEGWWYSTKIHPSFFGSAGARDLFWSAVGSGHQILSARDIYKRITSDTPEQPIVSAGLQNESVPLRYIGVDAQYFAMALLPPAEEKSGTLAFDEIIPVAPGDHESLDGGLVRLTNASFQAVTPVRSIAPGEAHRDVYTVFAGPKSSDVLNEYGLGEVLYYGWFPWVAKPLSRILHFFYAIVRNYGLAIILLTVLVRACMFPLSRKAAKNAAMMQQLAPEMKRIADKYKNDMEKRVKAQRELYAKYNFNPFGGCLLVFVQLPIFIGLYRCLSVDIELRQAPLIPGINWASNLAGPDMLWEWPLPEFLAGKTGFLGPYLNILPVATVVLFLVQQKLFTPPAMDEQQRMQQQMMKFMMVFIGIMFFKVPAGLCVYFIASSIWGIAERMLLPKPTPPAGGGPTGAGKEVAPRDNSPTGNGPPRRPERRLKKRNEKR